MMTFLQMTFPAFCVGIATGMLVFLAFTRKLNITVVTERQPQFQGQQQKQHYHQNQNHQQQRPVTQAQGGGR